MNYDSENLFAFGFLTSEKISSTPDAGLMCSDRNTFYLEIIPLSNPGHQNIDDTTVGNNFFKIKLYAGKTLKCISNFISFTFVEKLILINPS